MKCSSEEIQRQKNVTESKCQVCGITAFYSYYGAIVCKPCKVFFRRNAQKDTTKLTCQYGGHCQINLDNRHTCPACRLKRCFDIGMNADMFRPNQKRKKENQEVKVLPTVNLLENDRSILTNDQWDLITNISNCYNEFSGLKLGEDYLNEQNHLPSKMRYKTTSVINFIRSLLISTPLLYKNNQDFQSLSIEDRCLLLNSTYEYVGCLSTNIITQTIGLTDIPQYFDAIETTSPSELVDAIKDLIKQLHFDLIVMKILLSILSFSTINLTIYSNHSAKNFTNIQQILQIQNQYIDILWKYLIYKHNHKQTVIDISNLVRCISVLQHAIIIERKVEWHNEIVNETLVQQTEQILGDID